MLAQSGYCRQGLLLTIPTVQYTLFTFHPHSFRAFVYRGYVGFFNLTIPLSLTFRFCRSRGTTVRDALKVLQLTCFLVSWPNTLSIVETQVVEC